jgi:2-polyprenyl-3-methyl-5-hydroxy-6-metoxy-1,4-benzoquinol methylase
MVDRSAHWEGVYATKGAANVSWFQENPAISIELIRQTHASSGSAIIDVGGGASRLVDALLRDGYRAITVLDLSATALELAKERIGPSSAAVDWIVADVTTWKPVRQYEVWHDRAAFHFLTDPDDRRAYLDCLQSAVAPGGQVIIGTFALDGPEKCSGLPVQRYDSKSLAEQLGASFELVETRSEMHRTPWNSNQAFQFSRFRRR